MSAVDMAVMWLEMKWLAGHWCVRMLLLQTGSSQVGSTVPEEQSSCPGWNGDTDD